MVCLWIQATFLSLFIFFFFPGFICTESITPISYGKLRSKTLKNGRNCNISTFCSNGDTQQQGQTQTPKSSPKGAMLGGKVFSYPAVTGPPPRPPPPQAQSPNDYSPPAGKGTPPLPAQSPNGYSPAAGKGMGGARRFTITNRCSEPIWHVVFDNATQQSEQYEVFVGSSVAFRRPNGWTGSVWGKTGCVFNDTSCATGDTPSFTRAEFILASPGYLDFYYVSLLDGFNLPLVVKPIGGPGSGSGCGPTGCIADLNQICPTELRTQGGAVCRSECVAFGTPEYCCSGNYSGPEKCAPTNYSRVFTEACPTAYSYLYDAANSTFSCNSTSDYFITFCPPIGKNRAKEIITVVSASVSGVIIVSIIVCCFLKRRQNSPQRKRNRDVENLLLQHGALAPKRYRYSEIKKMTRSLSDKLGQGGFGSVYKGTLPDGRLVAVKILSEMDSNGEEFINEVASISRTFHVNIVTLLGFCHEGNKSALVYEYMPKKSLDKFLGNNGDGILDLNKLYEIVVGIAKGLEYLHTGCITRIVHFDIKPQNILLDQDLCPKISDFGLAKLCKKKQSVLSVLGTRGTAGYIAPEVFSRNFGGVSHKSDVYSYGMMLLEMAGARKIVGTQMIESSENYFPDEIYEQVIIDVTNSLDGEWMMIEEEEEKRRKMMLIGFWCIQTIPSERPSISKVVEMLEGTLRSIQIPPKPFLFSTVIPNQETSFSSFSANVETENS